MNSMLELVIQTALEAGRAIMQVYENPENDWQVERKADNSPLTLADRRSHAVIAAALAQTPYPVLSEEGEHRPYAEREAWHTLWVVDPLDGTKEFLKRNGEFTVNIALVRHGVPVMGVIYAPVLGRLYAAAEGHGAFVAQVDAATLQVGERKA
ncbi:MAG: 3'(2'),5'-bisphosphate nucleotidase CysQ, partial [Alloprevotella sp.]